MGVYIWTQGTPTSYSIADIIADPYSIQWPSGNLGKVVINYEFVDSERGICDVMINGESVYGGLSFFGTSPNICRIRDGDGYVAINLGTEYQSRTIVSHSGTVVIDYDNKAYSSNLTVILDGDESVPLQSSGALTGDGIGTIRNIDIHESYSTITGTITLTTGGGQKPLLSAHIGEPMYESYIIPDLSTSYNGTIPAGDAIKKIRIIFNVTNNLEWYGNGSIGSGSYSSISGSGNGIGLPGSLWFSFSTAQLQGTVEYDFNTSNATWDLTNGSGGTEAGSQGFYGWSLDGTQSIPITWIPQTWSTPPTGTIEIRVER